MKTSQRIQIWKTLTWTVISVSITTVIGWAITGNVYIGIGIGLTDRVIKMGIYYAHERFWHGKYKQQKQEKYDRLEELEHLKEKIS